MNLLEGDNLGLFLKGLTNEAVRAHGGAVPFPDVDANPEVKQAAAGAFERAEAILEGIDLPPPPLDKCPDNP